MNVQVIGGGMSVQYPIHMEIAGRVCVVIGGGRVAERKAHVLLQAGAHLIVIAPTLTNLLYQEASTGCFFWLAQPYEAGFLQRVRPFLVFCTADNRKVNRMAAEEARAAHALVNVADEPGLSDFFVPASIRRDRFLLTIGTGGLSPAFSRSLREQLEQAFPPAFGLWIERLSAIRQEMKEKLPTSDDRQAFWRMALSRDIMELVKAGRLNRAEVMIRHAIIDFRPKS
ncbi:siroheme synthase domain protein [Mitsuokella multacida DSM 20544]|uniref:precorrin-2 dehydrogenase n=2 Tax=Mitsuokella multacida TaxID=52226 RepID=C9KL83_9FIRM|nr:siroheme synthase domain protein [Mitsuokella multacida DSM 20544]